MRDEQVNRACTAVLALLSSVALLTVLLAAAGVVLSGQIPPREADEGTGARIFQMSIAALLPVGLAFLVTADWARPARILRRLAFPVGAVSVAFAVLYYFEQYLQRP